MVVFRQSRIWPFQVACVPAIVMVAGTPGFAAVYLTVEQAQQIMFPQQTLSAVTVMLSEGQRAAVKEKSGLALRAALPKVWRTDQGGYFIVDEVIGKHEYITFAVGINPQGSIRQVEILEYREAYGSEVRQKKWRRQFAGKTSAAALELNKDIKNISGATLSCRHVTEGVKRTVALYELILKK